MTATLTAYLQQLREGTFSAVVADHHRPLYQTRQNPYRGKLCLGNFASFSQELLKVLKTGQSNPQRMLRRSNTAARSS